MGRSVWIGLATLIAVAAGAWLIHAAERTRSPDRAPTIATQAGASEAPKAADADADASILPPVAPSRSPDDLPAAPAAAAPVPASDSDAPSEPQLRDDIIELDRRARAGDASAACRLAAELLACERARTMQPYTDNIDGQARMLAQRNSRPEEIDRQIDAALQRQAQNSAALARCEGVDETQWPPAARYFGLAAQAGHRPSMVQFLNAERYRSDQLFRDPGLIPLFRANAPRYFMTLVEAGDFELLQRWSMSAVMPHDILYTVLPPPWNDPGFATAMLDQSLRARGITRPDVARPYPPTPEQQAQADQLYARHFASRAAEQAEASRQRAQSPYDLAQYRCDDAPSAVAQ